MANWRNPGPPCARICLNCAQGELGGGMGLAVAGGLRGRLVAVSGGFMDDGV
jgi:hypothetical protein